MIAEIAKQMGGLTRADLTVDVTHMIVGDYDTPKYRYVAKHREDVRPMTLEWIETLRKLWINDQAIDMKLLEQQHTLPPFTSLRFSMTGCDDPGERQEIANQIKANGGEYEGDLTKRITHLISFRTEGNKYRAAKSWGLRIVSVEWLRDSLARGMILEEKLYDPVLPVLERGKGAVVKEPPPKSKRTSLGKRSRNSSVTSSDDGKRKLRRTASTKLSGHNESIWGDIVGGGMIAQVARSGVWEPSDEPTLPGNSIRPTRENTPSTLNLDSNTHPTTRGIFSGCRFYLHAFSSKQTATLSNHLLANGAEICTTSESLPECSQTAVTRGLYVIVPYTLSCSEFPALPQSERPIDIITEWWVERCLHQKQFIPPAEHVIGRPFPTFPIEGFRNMKISSTAFSGIDLLHVQRAVDLLGATYCEDMTPKSSVLVTKSTVGFRIDKSEHARDWKIPMVHATWLWDSIKAGVRLPFAEYQLRSWRSPGSQPATRHASSSTTQLNSEGSRSEHKKQHSKSSDNISQQGLRPPRAARLDDTAFLEDPILTSETLVKQEQDSDPSTIPEALLHRSSKIEPLSEINLNASTKPASTGDGSTAPTSEDRNSTAITDLLAKAKRHSNEGGQKRPRKQIIGRVMSNVSTASTGHSRATSIDSTATHGNPVEYPRASINEKPAVVDDEYEDFMSLRGSRRALEYEDNQPPLTQLQYEDPESKEHRNKVMAIMEGKEIDPTRSGLTKEKSRTIGDLVEEKPKTRTRKGKGR